MTRPPTGPPPRARSKVEHGTATMLLARTMYGTGDAWTPTQIRRYLVEQMGDQAPSLTTIRVWVIPGMAEARRQWKRDYEASRAGRAVASSSPVLDRMRQLADAGLAATAIAVVIAVDWEIQLTRAQVRYYLKTGKEPRLPKLKAGADDAA